MSHLRVRAAYGRSYTDTAAVMVDWLADKDFQINDANCRWNGKYINRPQANDFTSIIVETVGDDVVLTRDGDEWTYG